MAKVAVGVRIELGSLIEQMNEDNAELILEMLTDGYIEDSNDFYNEVFDNICADNPGGDWETQKAYFRDHFTTQGTLFKSRFSAEVEADNSDPLWNQAFLYPVASVLETDRWGYGREGTNGQACELPDLSALAKEAATHCRSIRDYEVVLMLKQNSG